MKPDWSSAPEWANYLAMNSDGCWWWFEHKPLRRFGKWWEHRAGKVACAGVVEIDWNESLEKRGSYNG